MRELFIDASRGLAGDMLSAALLELFDDPAGMIARLNDIGIPGVRYTLEKKTSHAIAGAHLRVEVFGEEEGHETQHHHHHRSLGDIAAIVGSLRLSAALKETVLRVYDAIAGAEAAAHGTTVELVHFHELGALDAVADICAACFLVDALAASRVTVSPVCTGFGSVKTAHGLLPVPAPATAKLLEGLPSFAGTLEGELCTPTGAALVKTLADGFSQMPPMRTIRTGYGLGNKNFGALSCVRAVLSESDETIVELCCNVDDMSPEAVGFAIEELLRAGAPDAWYEPIGMKKCRPGLLLCCLCREEQRDEMVRLLFRHTTTIGIRETLCRRYVLRRREETVATPYGPVRQKISTGYGSERRKAEYEDLARIARDQNISLREAEELLHDDP
ncbi:MAG: nickel pincer cofactor biosynthesis protein LarC [Oscillospiraceae bacterium]|nr:nickel pincer cofactor biosynthesis protein LarC [Oscillospiraceae bacterium]